DPARLRSDGRAVEVRVPDCDVHPRVGRYGNRAVRSRQRDVAGRTPGEVRHHRFQPQDLVQDGHPGRLVAGGVRGAQVVVGEQVPGAERDELPRGDHAGRAERHALAQDLRVVAALVDEVRDQVVLPFAAAGPDGRPDVAEVEAAQVAGG